MSDVDGLPMGDQISFSVTPSPLLTHKGREWWDADGYTVVRVPTGRPGDKPYWFGYVWAKPIGHKRGTPVPIWSVNCETRAGIEARCWEEVRERRNPGLRAAVEREVAKFKPLSPETVERLAQILKIAPIKGIPSGSTSVNSSPVLPIRDEPTTLYRYFDDLDRLLYVGITNAPTVRNEYHRRKSPWYKFASRKTEELFDSRQLAVQAERIAITTEMPAFNGTHQTDPHAKTRYVQQVTSAESGLFA